MNTNDNSQNAHNEIDHIFKDLLPNRGMAERPAQPVLISTSSIALQTAARDEYLPLLAELLMLDGAIDRPLQAVIRKGKSHYVCEERLERRLGQLDLQKKNWKAGAALLSLRGQLETGAATYLSGYDRERVCVPRFCGCQRETCRYRAFLKDCDSEKYPFQICNQENIRQGGFHPKDEILLQSGIRLLRYCRLNRAQTVDSYDTVMVYF